ncbi:MAG: hypothetical protein AVDCRST_MAG30-1795 [uncultured Solirubrobacteraceae bacterium]|uniref:Glucose/Sorbosone dehydrogenase domain-containing protein n=1 Tax=uncultured Solirubrobacteraceae bacterium TaxID=1162706 RepID=A0A6J4SGP7_9ACTN|nr:MAG: hypothetical protein AVDCRST_MAG30-1795 [uncultured Solirubrobacteraceae bacterium]
MLRVAALLIAMAALMAACAGGFEADAGASPGGGIRLVSIGGFESPVHVTAPPADERRVFVVEQEGRIMVVRGGRKLAEPFLDIRSKVAAGGERGLLSMAFAPDYARTGRFYVYYTDNAGHTRVVEYRRAGEDRADPGSARQVLFQRQPEPNHNGGLLLFGPDGLLYIGLGDGGGSGDPHGPRGNGQDLRTWLGKLLRIDPRASGGRPYRVPRSNPFVSRRGARPEIYAYGLRNPWRYSFDRATGDLTVADVGESAIEEVSFRRRGRGRGANFGWRVFEGRRRFASGESAPRAVAPVIERRHSQGACSITGGVVVRDPALRSLAGRYVFSDICDGRILSSRLSGRGASRVRATGLRAGSPSSFGEDARGRVYVASLDGPVYRLSAR